MKKTFSFSVFIFLAILGTAQKRAQVSIEKMWETDTVIRVPESVLVDNKRNTMYVSQIDGSPWEADGKGGIAKLSRDGMSLNRDWCLGLNCPKGMGIDGNKLYVADLDAVAVVNLKKGTVEDRIKPQGAENLNDIIVTPEGVVFVSDSKNGKIYRIENNKAELYLDSVANVNGLHYANTMLIAGSGKQLIRFNNKKERSVIATVTENIDGIEPLNNGDYVVSSWVGLVYYVYSDGKVITLLDTRDQKKNTADIGFDPYTLMFYVPTFFGKTVAAYQLKFKEQKPSN